MHKALRHTLLQSTHYNIDCTLCHFSILLHFFPALTDLMGLPLPAGSQVKGWLHAQLRSAAGADIPRKLASQAASTLINGGKQGMIRLLAEQQIYPSQQLLHACDIIAAGSHKVTARLLQGGLIIPPMDNYKRLGALIQRCESKVMLMILGLILPYKPRSILWLHDGLYVHQDMQLGLIQAACKQGATAAGVPHLEFHVTMGDAGPTSLG